MNCRKQGAISKIRQMAARGPSNGDERVYIEEDHHAVASAENF